MIPYGEMPKWGKTARCLIDKNRNSDFVFQKTEKAVE